MPTDFTNMAAVRQNAVDIFQGREWADPYNYGEVDPEGAWACLDLDGWYFVERESDDDPVGPFPTEAAAEIAWVTRWITWEG
jgi:hypothetical protein